MTTTHPDTSYPRKRTTPLRLVRRPVLDAPVPPLPLPGGRYVVVPGRGEFFVRDSSVPGDLHSPAEAPVVLLVHGWMFPSDLNWLQQYAPLVDAGYRVLAVDCRGHGRGLRSQQPFRLTDCAEDLAGILRVLKVKQTLVVGYSMGGPISQLLAREHPELVSGVVLCATALNWQHPWQKIAWRTMLLLRLLISAAPRTVWDAVMRGNSTIPPEHRAWVAGELSRGSAVDLAEAGRELGRYDSTPWLGSITPPARVILTTQDRLVPPHKQRELAAVLGVEPVPVEGDHDSCAVADGPFTPALLAVLADFDG